MDRTPTAHSTVSQSTHSSLPLLASAKDFYNMTNFYIPTLNSKKYNVLKLRELLKHRNQEKQNEQLRKKLRLPCSCSGERVLGKEVAFRSFKAHQAPLHPAYAPTHARNKRALHFYHSREKPLSKERSRCRPFLAESQAAKKYDHDE